MSSTGLKKALTSVHLWAIAVGLVISGEYFGWNYGWGVAGTVGFLIVTVAVTIMYVTFIFSYTELTTAIPHAGGPFAYAFKAFGPIGGLIAGYATVIEFVLATPAIAFALGSYTHFLFPQIPALATAISCYVIFTLINLLGIKESAVFTLVITLLAIAELLVFMIIVGPHFEYGNFMAGALPLRGSGLFAAIPFAIWFYLAIEGIAMVAEEVKDPRINIPRGYTYGILTLMFLAFGIMILTGGATDWQQLTTMDHPLPSAIGQLLGTDSAITRIFSAIGLFGLIASFHGIIISYSRQIFALARSQYLPSFLSAVNGRFQTPHWALFAGGLVGILSLLTGTADQLIILSALGAVVMYIVSMVSLFQLRRKLPKLPRPFRAPFYPYFPIVAIVLSSISLVAIVVYNPLLSFLFAMGFGVVYLSFKWVGREIKGDGTMIDLEESVS